MMVSIKERENMIQFLVTYFGEDPKVLDCLNDHTLESTYEFAYDRKEMESDF
jgi:hypothetical protein